MWYKSKRGEKRSTSLIIKHLNSCRFLSGSPSSLNPTETGKASSWSEEVLVLRWHSAFEPSFASARRLTKIFFLMHCESQYVVSNHIPSSSYLWLSVKYYVGTDVASGVSTAAFVLNQDQSKMRRGRRRWRTSHLNNHLTCRQTSLHARFIKTNHKSHIPVISLSEKADCWIGEGQKKSTTVKLPSLYKSVMNFHLLERQETRTTACHPCDAIVTSSWRDQIE